MSRTAFALRRAGLQRPPFAPIALVQHQPGNPSTSTITVTLNGVKAGNMLMFNLASLGTGGSIYKISSISDSSGDTWPTSGSAAAVAQPGSTGQGLDSEQWTMIASTAGTHTLTVTMSGTFNTAALYDLSEWSNVGSATPDVSNSTDTSSGSISSPAPSVTPNFNNELIVSVASTSGGNLSTGPSSPWVVLGSLGLDGGIAYLIQTTAAAASATFSKASGSSNWTQTIAGYKHS